MSRIRDALSKIEGDVRPLAPESYAPAPYETPVYAPDPYAPAAYDAAPAYDSAPLEAPHPIAPEAPTGGALPGIPGDFHRELSGLRFTLETALPDRATRVVQFAAAVAGEGTTTVAATFARILAQDSTQSVLLVDANLRSPGIGQFFGVPARPGLRELAGAPGADLESSLVAVERWNLHVLTAVPVAAEHGQLFQADALRDFWARHGRHYRWVIIDAAPVLDAPETATLGTTVDTTVLVIQAARTKRGIVQRAMDVFAKAGAPVLGAVLNRRRHDIPEFIYRRL
jgi:Mrp family chromosome partitioning ATPase